MKHVRNFADTRLIQGCVYCYGMGETQDHVPPKCLLDRPFPTSLHVVDCCESCNQNFSKDEEYFVCFIESVLCGSTDPNKIMRPSVARIMKDSPGLRKRIEGAKTEVNGQTGFIPEVERVENVMLKLARGHAAFDLSLPCREKPDHFWYGLLSSLPEINLESFNSVHFQQNVGEVGSRNMQNLLVMQMTVQDENGEMKNVPMLINDWTDVQDDRYRFIAINDEGMLIVRMVIRETFGCEVVWQL